MFTDGEYMWAWIIYLIGAAMFLAVCWVATKKIPWFEPKYLLRILCAVFLLVPWYTDSDSTYLSPAWIVSGIEGAFDGPEAFWRAGTPLLVTLAVAAVLTCLVFIGLWFRSRSLAQAT